MDSVKGSNRARQQGAAIDRVRLGVPIADRLLPMIHIASLPVNVRYASTCLMTLP